MIPLPLIITVIALVLSNAATMLSWLNARSEVAQLQERLENTVDVARECSRGVEALRVEADKRVIAAKASVAAAAKSATAGDKRADQILARPAPVPGNDCASAQAQIDEWLSNRGPVPP